MNTMDLNSARIELAREILSTDSWEVLNAARNAIDNVHERILNVPSSLEELNSMLLEDDGKSQEETSTLDEVDEKIKKKYQWLCK